MSVYATLNLKLIEGLSMFYPAIVRLYPYELLEQYLESACMEMSHLPLPKVEGEVVTL